MIFQSPQSERALSIFSDSRQLQAMLEVEAALARAEARCGIIPLAAAESITDSSKVEFFDLPTIMSDSTLSGNIAIPFVRQLTKIVSQRSPGAEAFVHWGATSQDILDTALVLQLRELFALTRASLDVVCKALAMKCRQHAATPMAGRTWLQHATPTTFGLKLAGALDTFHRHFERLDELTPRVLAIQFGGAAGTLAFIGSNTEAVSAAFAEELGLELPDMPWHSYRDRIVEVAGFYSALTVTVGKLANDLALLMQTEIAEIAESDSANRGGSSTMPHKRNPVLTAAILSQTARVPALNATILTACMLQQHERGLTGWQTEWFALPDLCIIAQSTLEALGSLLLELTVDAGAMLANLDRTRGLLLTEAVSMALAPTLGRSEAHALLQDITRRAAADSVDLGTALRANPAVTGHLSDLAIDRLLDPSNYLGSASMLVQRVLDRYAGQDAGGGN